MTLTLEEWHLRFLQQAGWTEPLRAHLFARAGIRDALRMLEVGCGTGAVCASIARENPAARVVGLDFDLPRLHFARAHDPNCRYTGGNAFRLPFADGVFDLTFCHFLLLWVRKPQNALREMVRVTRRGGWVAALAEPDYGGRIDHPEALAAIGRMQSVALRRQGADPGIGRTLAGLFSESGVRVETSGVLGAELPPGGEDSTEAALELKILKDDLGENISEGEWETIRAADRAARASGRRVLYIPTFYTAGTV
ncbi:MAG: methyltransferase domain-containing protein [Anaerolineales bacterium]|nr:methyltransferase domain-containing protein [Anaerolineales bacterium]